MNERLRTRYVYTTRVTSMLIPLTWHAASIRHAYRHNHLAYVCTNTRTSRLPDMQMHRFRVKRLHRARFSGRKSFLVPPSSRIISIKFFFFLSLKENASRLFTHFHTFERISYRIFDRFPIQKTKRIGSSILKILKIDVVLSFVGEE